MNYAGEENGMSDDDDLYIPEDGGLQTHQQLLALVENKIAETARKVTQYKVDRGNARSVYDDLLSTAKIVAIEKHNLKPAHQTLINAYANADADVKIAKQAWLLAKAMETKAVDRLEQLQGQRDTLKALVKSHHTSW